MLYENAELGQSKKNQLLNVVVRIADFIFILYSMHHAIWNVECINNLLFLIEYTKTSKSI